MARRTRRKKTGFAKNHPREPTIGLFRFPRIGRSSHWIIHGAGARNVSHTAHSLSAHVLPDARVYHPHSNVHTRTLTKTGRLNGCFSLDTHTHTHLVSTVSHRHDARTRIKPRKKKEKITTRPPGTRVPPRFFTRVCGLGLAMTRCSIGPFSISFFLLFYDYSGRVESVWMTQERDNLFTTVFVLYIIDGRKKKKKKQGNSGNRNLSLGRHVTIYRGYYS